MPLHHRLAELGPDGQRCTIERAFTLRQELTRQVPRRSQHQMLLATRDIREVTHLTGLVGFLLMRGQFVSVGALGFPVQTLAWAVVAGYAQQVLTHLVDCCAHSVVEAIGGGRLRAGLTTA